MSASKMTTNGGSLENCHTNVFALTELNGLKWKCLTTPLTQRTWTSLEQDPVLSAYAKCLQAGILCAWRRQPPQQSSTLNALPLPDYRIDVVKELWVFWYSQEEPNCLAEFTSHLMSNDDAQGNWSVPGIQYETRTLFFKALHNLIERSLMKHGFIRIGKYFARPYDVPSADRVHCSPSYLTGISFNFFVHGENTVCANVNVQRQPTLFRLSRRHLHQKKRQPVVLGPWSLRATLVPDQPKPYDVNPVSRPFESTANFMTPMEQHALYSSGNVYGTAESAYSSPSKSYPPLGTVNLGGQAVPNTTVNSGENFISRCTLERFWTEWLQFFGLPNNSKLASDHNRTDGMGYVDSKGKDQEQAGEIPKMVLVDVDGIHMWYPSSLVVIQASEDLLLKKAETESSEEEMTGNQNATMNNMDEVPTSSAGNVEQITPLSARKRRRKQRETELDGSNGERRNMMYNRFVNGSRAAQRYLEETCLLPSCARKKEAVESPATSNLGLLMSGATNDEDSRWNITDGNGRKDRENEQCSCRQCTVASSSRVQPSSGVSTPSSLVASDGSQLPMHQSPLSTSTLPVSISQFVYGSKSADAFDGKEHEVPFHRRSPSFARSPSPPRSPAWEKRFSLIASEIGNADRSSPDWVHEFYGYGSNISSSGRQASDIARDERYQFPPSPVGVVPDAPDSRHVHIKRYDSSQSRANSCKPVYQNLSPSSSRPRTPVGGNVIQEPSCRLSIPNFLTKRAFSSLNDLSDAVKMDDSQKVPVVKMENINMVNDPLKAIMQNNLKEDVEFRKTRTSHRKNRNGRRKLEWAGVENLDVSHITISLGEDEASSMPDIYGSARIGDTSQESHLTDAVVLSSESVTTLKPSKPGFAPMKMISTFGIDENGSVMRTSSLSMETDNISGRMGSEAYGVDGEPSSSSFTDDASPSTVAMMDTSSPSGPPNDSVHLSPPASNERVESSMYTINASLANNILGRVGGPPSVGDYKIYPTPPSVDATQSQQFSPQNVIVQSNSSGIICPANVQSFMSVLPSYTTNATAIGHSIQQTHPPILSAMTSNNACDSEIWTDTGSLITVKHEREDVEEKCEIKTNKLERLLDEIPVFGNTRKMEVALNGKFAGDLFDGDTIPFEVKNLRVPPSVYADQMKVIAASLASRKKRKTISRPPDYLRIRDQFSSVGAHRSTPNSRHYRLHYRMTPSSSAPNLHGGSINAMYGFQQACTSSGPTGYPPNCVPHVPFPVCSASGTMMGNSMLSGGMHVMNVPGSPSMMMHGMNPHSQMGSMRGPGRPQSLAYGPITSVAGHSHRPGFVGSPVGYCGPLSGMMNHMSTPSQMIAMHGHVSQVGQMNPSLPRGIMPSGTPPLMTPVSQFHQNSHHQQQPFQQLSQFVNNTNFAVQQGPPGLSPQQQQVYHQQMLYRGMQGNVTPQHSMQSPGSYMLESQASTPIEPPPSFSQAISGQYSGISSAPVSVSASEMYDSSSQGSIRSSMGMNQSRPGSVVMPGTPHAPHTPMMMSQGSSISLSGSVNNRIFPGRTVNMQQVDLNVMNLPTVVRTHPEGKSLVLSVLLQDTVLDLHYDSVFDACPICSCNGNIRAKELGVYITPPEVLRQSPAQQQSIVSKPTSGFYNNTVNTCNCGFSAVRHRYLSMKAGLFPEDAKEATDITENPTQPSIPHTIWFDSMSGRDMNFIALLREQCLVRDLGGLVQQVSMLSMQCQRASQFERIGSDSSDQTEYIISDVDQRELSLVFQAACEVACMEMNCRRPPHDMRTSVLHEWGVQIANEMREPREAECLAVLEEVGPILEETLRVARSAPLYSSNNIVEGPLTWRHFDRKSLKTGCGTFKEDESCPEPVPSIIVASERDAIIASPEIIRMWEKMTLEPYDQPKDILYVAVVPDNIVCFENSKKYFDDLSRVYEQFRFGRHIPLCKEPLKEGILRVPARFPATNSAEFDNFLNQVERHMGDNKSLINRLKAYMQCFENELAKLLLTNDCLFDRETYRKLLFENQNQISSILSQSPPPPFQSATANTPPLNSEQMPPPAMPNSASSGSMLTASQGSCGMSGPSSVGQSVSCIGEPLTPEGASTADSGSTAATTTAMMAEQCIIPEDEPFALPHVIVIYLVNPFLMGGEQSPLAARVVTVALMRAFNALLYRLASKRRPQLQLEIVSLQSILDYTGVSVDILKDDRGRLNAFDQGRAEKNLNERLSSMDSMKMVAFSVYSQSRIVLADVVRGMLPKSMTRFGPASAMGDLLDELDKKEPIFYKVRIPYSKVMNYEIEDIKLMNVFLEMHNRICRDYMAFFFCFAFFLLKYLKTSHQLCYSIHFVETLCCLHIIRPSIGVRA
ncbi:hypothetical protein AB6A40_003299 [Gnathostoma spinigerum]|uniref:Mediator of RNA polymerase II transcription subunit 13 n=1 Tax=Gnathostoma spinigerum TaxID=75299 RepID=A0ABD6EK01_9BILA